MWTSVRKPSLPWMAALLQHRWEKKGIQIGQGYRKFVVTGTCKEAVKVSLVMEITFLTSRKAVGEFIISWVRYILGCLLIRLVIRCHSKVLHLECNAADAPNFVTWASIFLFVQNQWTRSFPSQWVRNLWAIELLTSSMVHALPLMWSVSWWTWLVLASGLL